MKKRLLAVLAAAALVLGLMTVPVFADEAPTVYVTIANGSVVMNQQAVAVSDIDKDGALTINDALYLAHEASFEGGAAAGYGSAEGSYGLSLTKLWGVENGGSYGYYVNNTAAMGLADPVKGGDYIYAFVYTDTTGWSDAYSYFNANALTVNAGDEIPLVLSYVGYDADWNPVALPAEGAVITINGAPTDVKTDAEGKAVITISEAGSFVISATSETQTLVPPVLNVTTTPATGNPGVFVYGIVCVMALAGILLLAFRSKRAL